MNRGGIAFFDSGIGGLTILRACMECIPNQTFYYYGDNAHAPYGNLPQAKIKRNVYHVFHRLARLKPKAVVVACNTATAVCVEELRKKYSFPVIGVEPAVLSAAKKGGRVLVLATRATCASERVRILKEKAELAFPSATICLAPCVELAGCIEQHAFDPTFDFTPYLPKIATDAVVLGCTHYPFIKKQIKAYYQCPVFDSSDGVVRRLQTVLSLHDNVKTGGVISKTGEERLIFKNMRPLVTPMATDGKMPQIYFIGRSKRHNQSIFEQMFANPFK